MKSSSKFVASLFAGSALGNVKLFANDLAGALFGEIRIGSLGNRLQRATGPGGRSTTDQVAKKLADAVQSANAGFLWPELCK